MLNKDEIVHVLWLFLYGIIPASAVVHCGEVWDTKGLFLQNICIILSTLLVKNRGTISVEGSGDPSHHSDRSRLSFTPIKYVG